MSLTQERINEIAMECWNYYLTNASSFTVTDTYNHFLSRIREEQEPFGYVLNEDIEYLINEPDDRTIPLYQESGDRPLFTIPSAAPECDCKELVKDAERYRFAKESVSRGDVDIAICRVIWTEFDAEYQILCEEDADEAIDFAKHKASMGEKE